MDSKHNVLKGLHCIQELTLYILGNFSCFCCCLLTLKKKSVTRSEFLTFWNVGPDLGPNCLQKLSVDDKSHHWQANN